MELLDRLARRPHLLYVTSTLPPQLVLYDGLCGLCDKSVQWVLRHDADGTIRFAALESPLGQEIRARHPELPPNLDSILFVVQHQPDNDAAHEKIYWRSRAAFEVLRYLPRPWRWFSVLRWFPSFPMDVGYRWVARIRYGIWGKLEACRVPSAEERSRFLS